MQRPRRLALDQDREPHDEREHEGGEPPERRPTTRWGIASSSRKRTVSARAAQVVGDDEPDRVRRPRRGAPGRGRGSRPPARILVGVPVDHHPATRRLPVTPDDVRRAADDDPRARPPDADVHARRASGPGRHLKAELFQRTGSFKARGVLNRLAALDADERARGVIGVSAGNHAQALAWGAAEEESTRSSSCGRARARRRSPRRAATAPRSTSRRRDPGEAFERLHRLQEESGRVFVHPFDDPVVIAGAGTVGLEILEDVPGVDTIVVASRRRRARRRHRRRLRAGRGARRRRRARAVERAPARRRRGRAGAADARDRRRRPHGALRRRRSRSRSAGGSASTSCSSRRTRSARRSASSTSAPSSPQSRAARPPSPPSWPGRVDGETVVVVVSGGNVSAEIASAILAGR